MFDLTCYDDASLMSSSSVLCLPSFLILFSMSSNLYFFLCGWLVFGERYCMDSFSMFEILRPGDDDDIM